MAPASVFSVTGVDHVNLETPQLDASVAFYQEVLGLELGWRPPFDVPGAWLYAGDRPVIHLVLRHDAPQAKDRPVNHFAFQTTGLASLKERLTARGLDFEETTVPGTKIVQIFFRDPNNVGVECSFNNLEA